MKITRMYISLVEDKETSHVATASVTLDNVLTIHGINLIKNSKTDEFFIVFAYKKMSNGKNAEIYGHPLNSETRTLIKDGIIEGYKKALDNPEESLVVDSDEGDAYELSMARVTPFAGEGMTKAYASIVLNDSFLLRGMKVILKKGAEEGSKDINDYFVAMPRRMIKKTGKVKNVYNPVDTEFYNDLQKKIMDEFEKTCL